MRLKTRITHAAAYIIAPYPEISKSLIRPGPIFEPRGGKDHPREIGILAKRGFKKPRLVISAQPFSEAVCSSQ
jgi:hypothetical protein